MASIYSQNLGVLSPASDWSRVTHTVSFRSGRYRISLEGFKAINVTAEDPFRSDGRGDEVFISTQVSEYGPNASLVSTRMARTNFHAAAAPNVPFRSQFDNYVPWTGGDRPVLDTWNPVRSCPRPISPESPRTLFVPPISGWRDEPIDMQQDHSYCPTYVAINWRLANSMTTVNPATVVEIPFTSSVTNWQYKLYVRIEKVVPTAVPVVAPVSRRRSAGP